MRVREIAKKSLKLEIKRDREGLSKKGPKSLFDISCRFIREVKTRKKKRNKRREKKRTAMTTTIMNPISVWERPRLIPIMCI